LSLSSYYFPSCPSTIILFLLLFCLLPFLDSMNVFLSIILRLPNSLLSVFCPIICFPFSRFYSSSVTFLLPCLFPSLCICFSHSLFLSSCLFRLRFSQFLSFFFLYFVLFLLLSLCFTTYSFLAHSFLLKQVQDFPVTRSIRDSQLVHFCGHGKRWPPSVMKAH